MIFQTLFFERLFYALIQNACIFKDNRHFVLQVTLGHKSYRLSSSLYTERAFQGIRNKYCLLHK